MTPSIYSQVDTYISLDHEGTYTLEEQLISPIENVMVRGDVVIFSNPNVESESLGIVRGFSYTADGDAVGGDFFTIIDKEPERIVREKEFTWYQVEFGDLIGWIKAQSILF